MNGEVSFRGQLGALADEYERVSHLNTALQKDNDYLRTRLASSEKGPSGNSSVAVGAMAAHKLEARTPETFVGAVSLDDLVSSIPSDIPQEVGSDGLAQGVLRDVAQHVAQPAKPRISINGDVAVMPSDEDVEIYTSGFSSISGSHDDTRVSYMSVGKFSHNDSKRVADPSLHIPIFPKYFDPGPADPSEFDAMVSQDSDGFPGEWVPPQPKHGCCVLMPVGRLRLSWDMFAAICLMVDLWVTPFELFFLRDLAVPIEFEYIQHSITGFFGADILLNFITGFVEEDRTIMERGRIIKHYFRTWFWIDLIATVPFDLILMSVGTGMFSVARLGKASKVVKTLRYLKLMRAIRLVKLTAQANTLTQHFPFLGKVRRVALPVQVLTLLALIAHVHCCFLREALETTDKPSDNSIISALRTYFETFWWAYCAITVGAALGPVDTDNSYKDTPWIWLVEMAMVSEHLCLLFLASIQVIFKSLTFFDDARRTRARDQVLKYLRQHRVSFKTQIQVLYSLRDTGQAKKYQMYATELFANELPRELRHVICYELWAVRLESLGLISEVGAWHRDLVQQLTLIVYEEVFPSRAILFKMGDSASAAYHIIKGELIVGHVPGMPLMPDFTKGMWVGESALTSALLRRSATIVTKSITSLMVVPGSAFLDLVSKSGLTEQYQRFLTRNLWKGVCGRCGALGEHFSDTCDSVGMVGGHKRSSNAVNIFSGAASEGGVGELSFGNALTMSDINQELQHFNLEMKRYLISQSLDCFMPAIRQSLPGVYNLDALISTDLNKFKKKLEMDGWILTKEQDMALSELAIERFRESNAERVAQTLFRQVSRLHHLIFLSHYKLEAGTEAALMRTELEQAIEKDPGSPGHYFDAPVFLDSENLTNLEDLQVQVKSAHNLVLLLTKGVLTRPWVLIEIVTAIREGVRIHLVTVSKAGCEFEFPNDDFYDDVMSGDFMDEASWEVINRCGISNEEVSDSIRTVMKKIAVPYSPHKATGIRQAEINSLLKQCQLKDA